MSSDEKNTSLLNPKKPKSSLVEGNHGDHILVSRQTGSFKDVFENEEVRDSRANIQIPQSEEVNLVIPGLSEYASELKDKVNPLNKKNQSSDLESDSPYNFHLEKVDSFMIDSEEGIKNNTLNSSKLAKIINKPSGERKLQTEIQQALWISR